MVGSCSLLLLLEAEALAALLLHRFLQQFPLLEQVVHPLLQLRNILLQLPPALLLLPKPPLWDDGSVERLRVGGAGGDARVREGPSSDSLRAGGLGTFRCNLP